MIVCFRGLSCTERNDVGIENCNDILMPLYLSIEECANIMPLLAKLLELRPIDFHRMYNNHYFRSLCHRTVVVYVKNFQKTKMFR